MLNTSEIGRLGIPIAMDYDSHDGLWYFYLSKEDAKPYVDKYYSGFVVITL